MNKKMAQYVAEHEDLKIENKDEDLENLDEKIKALILDASSAILSVNSQKDKREIKIFVTFFD